MHHPVQKGTVEIQKHIKITSNFKERQLQSEAKERRNGRPVLNEEQQSMHTNDMSQSLHARGCDVEQAEKKEGLAREEGRRDQWGCAGCVRPSSFLHFLPKLQNFSHVNSISPERGYPSF